MSALPKGLLSNNAIFTWMVLYFHSHSSVCGSQAKSRTLYGEGCHLRFGLMVTSGTQRLLLSYRDDDICVFGVLNYENMFILFS